MANTCTIGGVSFTALNNSTGRKCLTCVGENPAYAIIRFHVPGSDGNAIIRPGRTGKTITAKLRYIEALATAIAAFESDKNAWANTAVTVVDEGGVSTERCNLQHARIVTDARSLGASNGVVFFDVVAVFTQD